MTLYMNSCEGATNGAALSIANSGGASGTPFSQVSVTGAPTYVFTTADKAHGNVAATITGADTETAFIVFTLPTATGGLASRVYFKLAAAPTTTVDLVTHRNGSGNVTKMQITGTLRILTADTTGTKSTSTAAIPTGVWLRAELLTIVGSTTSNGTIHAQIFTGDDTTSPLYDYLLSAANTGTTQLTNWRTGKITATGPLTVGLDEFAWTDAASTMVGPWTGGNIPPNVSAGTAQTVEPLSTVTLAASATDFDGTISSVTWRQIGGTAVTLSGAGATRTFTAPASQTGDGLVFGVTAVDNAGASSGESTVTITVLPATEFYSTTTGAWKPMQIRSTW